MPIYQDYKIKKNLYSKKKDFRLEQSYEMCVSELGLQQSKRDQIIAFYIAIISFVIPAIIELDMNNYVKSTGFFILFILGNMLGRVIVRYRIYKEVYWITCRTISQLYSFDQNKITKTLVQHIFYATMEKNKSSVIVVDNKKENKIKKWKTFIKIQSSAETILYNVMVLMSSLVLWIGIFMLIPSGIYRIILATVIVLINYIYSSKHYYDQLTNVYAVFKYNTDCLSSLEKLDESFNATYSKAWFLHSFYKEPYQEN